METPEGALKKIANFPKGKTPVATAQKRSTASSSEFIFKFASGSIGFLSTKLFASENEGLLSSGLEHLE